MHKFLRLPNQSLCMDNIKILIVDDEPKIVEICQDYLKASGFDVVAAGDGLKGLATARREKPDLVVLDLMLPVVDGLDVCRRLRADASTRDMLIVMVTAKAEESDELIGFSLGADDYVAKPYSVKVLLERIKALRRRRAAEAAYPDEITNRLGVTVDRRRHQASVDGKVLQLTRSEFRLLDTLIRQPGRVFHRTELIDAALGEDTMVMGRTIDVHIRALRRKLDQYQDVIETVRGVGYRFRDSAVAAEVAGEV